MKKKHYFRGKFYSSGNKMVDWLFRRFVHILNEKVKNIVFRTPIRDYEKPRKTILGQSTDEDIVIRYGQELHYYNANCIYIDPNPKTLKEEETDIISIFIHELCHFAFSDNISEKLILSLDKLLSSPETGFSERQKRALCIYLPNDKKLGDFLKNSTKYKTRLNCPAEISKFDKRISMRYHLK